MCGNSLEIAVDVPKNAIRRNDPNLDSIPVDIEIPRTIYSATLTGAEFPIAGNTEQTKNSQSNAETFDDAFKMNEYLNWYLTGATDKAELVNNPNRIVDFSGPIKKLLPSVMQDAQRVQTIKYLNTAETYSTDPPDGQTGAPVTDVAVIHNQIVACAKNSLPNLPKWMRDLLGIPTFGYQIPIECYPNGNGSGASGDVYRLNEWKDESDLSKLISAAGSALNTFVAPSIVSRALADVANRWKMNYPPLPWADEDGNPFPDQIAYQKAYNEWRGKICFYNPLPFSRPLVCVSAWPVLNNPFSDLYKYVPLSNTVDKHAKNWIYSVGIKPGNKTILTDLDDPKYIVNLEPILYFPHTAEVSEASDFLNKTYIPKEGTSSDPIPETTESGNDPITGKCQILDVRTNEGDYLFPEVKPGISEVNVTVNPYTVTQIPCVQKSRTIRPDPLNPDYKVEELYSSCQGTVYITIRMQTKVPYADEIYNSTTAGADSTFRKMFPKVGEGAPVSCISNLPSSTSVQYIPKENMDKLKVIGPLGNNTTDDPKLYFPHFGSVYDLFLKGIQTALRPKGFGEPIKDGKFCGVENVATGDCKMWLFEDSPGGGKYYDKVISAAAGASCRGKSLNPAWALAIALNENGGLMSDLEDGSSTTHFGCDITGAAGYTTKLDGAKNKIQCMIDTLVNGCNRGLSDEQILANYGYPSGYVMWPVTILMPGAYPPPLFGASVNSDDLKARLLTTNWYDSYKEQASTFCPNSPTLVEPDLSN
jgi:hypothetical protein